MYFGSTDLFGGASIPGDGECNGVNESLVNQPCIAVFDSNPNGVNSPISWNAPSIGCGYQGLTCLWKRLQHL